ncbi:MAG: ParB/RepB/Spo0J family partition protein [Proteobacteria bacterium]|nr:ParB/RepB/Spo0J family partition protein [Pseudomonadota bacterium]
MSTRLGKGLGALLDEGDADLKASTKEGAVAEKTLPVTSLEPSDAQPRRFFDEDALKSLAASIKEQGVLQPLLVRPKKGTVGRYEIIAGERRWRASQEAGLTEVPVIIREMDDSKALEVALVENVQRSDLNPIDEAAGYLRLVNEFNYTHEDMARVTGKSRSHITNLMRLLSLPEKVRQLVSSGGISMGHARALLALNEKEGQIRAAMKVMKDSLSVRETEEMVRKLLEEEQGVIRRRRSKDDATKELEDRVSSRLGGLKVAISQKNGSGAMKIAFASEQELTSLLSRLGM